MAVLGNESGGVSRCQHYAARRQCGVALAGVAEIAHSRKLAGGAFVWGASGLRGFGGVDCRVEKHALDGFLSGRAVVLVVLGRTRLRWRFGAAGGEGNRRYYALALAAFLAALLAKVSVVVLPAVLLLLAWWRRGRIARRDWERAAPFFLLAVALGSFGMTFQNKYAALNDPLPARLLAGGWAVWFYLWKIFWPVHLTVIYPRWDIQAVSPAAWIPGICFAAMLFVFWRKRAGWGRPLLFATGYFVISLAPVLGPFKLVYFYFSQAADHLQYLAMPSIVALAAAAGWRWLGRTKTAGGALGAAVAMVLSVLTWQNQSRFAGMSSLWRDNLAMNPRSFQALIFLGAEEENRGHYEKAGELFQRAVAVRPQSYEANLNLGIVFDDQGRTNDAVARAKTAERIKPGKPEAHDLLARLLEKQGLLEEAAQELREAVRVGPDNFAARQDLGNLLVREGRLDEAVREFGEALKLKSDDPALFVALGNAQGKEGTLPRRWRAFRKRWSWIRATPTPATEWRRCAGCRGRRMRPRGRRE